MRKGDANPAGSSRDSNSDVRLLRERTDKIRSLSGYQKSHRLPQQSDSRADEFVAIIASSDIAQHLDEMHGLLRQQFKLKRKEIVVSEIIEGSASITTPGFRYDVSVTIDSEDPSLVSWHHQMSDITNQQLILEDRFGDVFGDIFNTVEFSASTGIDVEALIDCVEDLEDPRIELDYPHDASTCTIQFAGQEVSLFFDQSGMRLVHPHPRPPVEILHVYFELQASLGTDIELPALSSKA